LRVYVRAPPVDALHALALPSRRRGFLCLERLPDRWRFEVLQGQAVPRFIIPSAPVLKAAPPSGDDWIHEIKFDGFRGQLHKAGDDVVIFSRKGGDFTRRFAAVRDSVLSLRRDPQLSTQRSSCATAMASPTLKH
jgi:ATP-dependent DNA ligase